MDGCGGGKIEGRWLWWREDREWMAAVEGGWRGDGCSRGRVEGGWLWWREDRG